MIIKEYIIDAISSQIFVSPHDDDIHGVEEAADKIMAIVSKNDLLLEKLAISIVKSYCSDDDIDESCCVFCNTDLSRNNEYKHNDNCVVPQAMRWLMENKMYFT